MVALNYGCGAHSEVEGGEVEGMAIVVTDEAGWDPVDLSDVEDLPADEPVEVSAVDTDEAIADDTVTADLDDALAADADEA